MMEQVLLIPFSPASEIAETTLFLASSNISYFNRVELPVDGGITQIQKATL